MFILTDKAVLINVDNVTDIEVINNELVAHLVTKESVHVMHHDDVYSAVATMREIGEALADGECVCFLSDEVE